MCGLVCLVKGGSRVGDHVSASEASFDHVVIFMSHLHLNELSLICDMWVNKITYLLTSEFSSVNRTICICGFRGSQVVVSRLHHNGCRIVTALDSSLQILVKCLTSHFVFQK